MDRRKTDGEGASGWAKDMDLLALEGQAELMREQGSPGGAPLALPPATARGRRILWPESHCTSRSIKEQTQDLQSNILGLFPFSSEFFHSSEPIFPLCHMGNVRSYLQSG